MRWRIACRWRLWISTRRSAGSSTALLDTRDHTRKKFRNDSFTFPDPEQIQVDRKAGYLILPKFGKTSRDNGPVRSVFHRPLKGRVKRVTIVREGAHWYASILVSIRVRRAEAPQAPITPDDVLGVDRGVEVPVATSAGDLFGGRIATELDRKKSSRLQRNLARTRKGSRRREKTLKRLRTHQARIARRRRDACHKITSHLAKNHRVIVIESLRVQAMTGSARGTAEAPGLNVAQKSGLNRSILDIGWGEIRRQLAYKLAWRGGQLVEVPARDTSRTCARCHAVDASSRVQRDLFRCTSCGYEARDEPEAQSVHGGDSSHFRRILKAAGLQLAHPPVAPPPPIRWFGGGITGRGIGENHSGHSSADQSRDVWIIRTIAISSAPPVCVIA